MESKNSSVRRMAFSSIAVMMFAGTIAFAQPGPGPLPDRRGGPGPRPGGLIALTTLTGQVGELLANEEMVYDGFNLTASGTNYVVKFPAHLGTQIVALAKKGSMITVSGVQEISPSGVSEFRLTSLSSNGKVINDTPPVPDTAPPTEEFTTKTGKIEAFQYDLEGRVNGVKLSSNTILRLPPHIGYQISNQVKAGDMIEATGFINAKHAGEVMAGNYTIIRSQTVKINGQEYLVR